MKKILLPTDFSENAYNAIKYALKLFKDESCIFYLLNTYTPTITSYDLQMNSGGFLSDVTDIIKNDSIDRLNKLQNKLINKYTNTNHQFEIISSFNTLTDEIKEQIKSKGIDLVVMGTKGASGIKEVLFGSNTIHTIQKVKCPILAIPDGYFFETPTEILFPTDYKIDYSEKQLFILKAIAKSYKSKINVMHVSYGSDLNEIEKINKSNLAKLLKESIHQFHNVSDAEIPKAIDTFQNTTYVQLLVMINNKHSFFENLFFKPVINQIGFHLNVPFLVIPSKF